LTDLTQLLLGIIQQEEITDKTLKVVRANDVKIASDDTATVFSDGGSRGNPGPSAAGYVMLNNRQEVVAEGGEYLGITTNNQAEYHGVRIGLEKALELKYKRVDFKIDSMLVVNQMKGLYKVKNRELWPIHERIRALMQKFDKVTFTHVAREFNQLADGMVNKTLDARAREKSTTGV
jgi:ribonuclease HI